MRYDDRASRRIDSASAEAATLGDVGDDRVDTRSSSALNSSLSAYFCASKLDVAEDCHRCVNGIRL